jgi:hypothetical protein
MESDGRIDGNSRRSRSVTVISLTNLQITRAKPKAKQYKPAWEGSKDFFTNFAIWLLGFLGACSHGSSDEQFFGALFRDYPFWRVINLFVRQ